MKQYLCLKWKSSKFCPDYVLTWPIPGLIWPGSGRSVLRRRSPRHSALSASPTTNATWKSPTVVWRHMICLLMFGIRVHWFILIVKYSCYEPRPPFLVSVVINLSKWLSCIYLSSVDWWGWLINWLSHVCYEPSGLVSSVYYLSVN